LTSLQQRILEHDPSLAVTDHELPGETTRDADGHGADLGRSQPRGMQRAPAPATPILGRVDEIEAICGVLEREDARLVTLAARWLQAQQRGAALSYEVAIRTALDDPAAEAPPVQRPRGGAPAKLFGVTGGFGA
jgi:hypothetical protein